MIESIIAVFWMWVSLIGVVIVCLGWLIKWIGIGVSIFGGWVYNAGENLAGLAIDQQDR